jgi:hypothetical protein
MSVNNNLQVGSGRIRVAKFTASGSWTAPAGVFSIQALAVGGGGGGGASKSTNSATSETGGGGGGGGVVDGMFPVVPGTTYTVTIGTGGAGANTTTAAGSNGTDTTFGSLFTAPGGQGGVTDSNGTRVSPTSNPGGSMGGWGRQSGATDTISSGHGCGAATPIIPVSADSTSAVDDIFQPSQLTFFNGISNVTVPIVHRYEQEVGGILTILQNTDTNTTHYNGVKRNVAIYFPANSTYFSPGFAWKGLGAGGASLLTTHKANASASWIHFIEPSAGKVAATSTTTPNANTFSINGTNGMQNTGAGGGGSASGGTISTVSSGGNGGSGYVEVVWVE